MCVLERERGGYIMANNNSPCTLSMQREEHEPGKVSKETWCLTATETMRLIRDGENGRKGV